MSKTEQPLVSIHCITYNHEQYIAQTLDGFLMQKTNFPHEIIIHDDASTDKTVSIIKKYAKENPGIIKPVFEKTNQFSKNSAQFVNDLFLNSEGKYIAQSEGDDYWTDPSKLQTQVDFMEAHKDYALCFHPVKVVFEKKTQPSYVYPDPSLKANNFTLQALLAQNYIQSNSVMYRKLDDSYYKKIPKNITPRDWYTHLLHAQFGKIGFIDKVMSVYRRHEDGIWWSKGDKAAFWQKYGINHVELFNEFLKMYGKDEKLRKTILDSMFNVFNILIDQDIKYHTQLVKSANQEYPDLFLLFVYDQREKAKTNLVLENKIEALTEANKSKAQELQDIYNSKGWRLLDKYHSAKVSLTKKGKK